MGSFKKRGVRATALGLAAAGLAGLLAVSAPSAMADEYSDQEPSIDEQFNTKGLWITEMHIYDVDTYKDCFVQYPFSGEQMEFVEITNTSDDDISLNDYGLYYEENNGEPIRLEISDPEGENEFLVPARGSVVIWNQRTELGDNQGTDYASLDQFREFLMVPDDAEVYTVHVAGGFANDNCGFILEDPQGNVRSQYHYTKTSGDQGQQGLSHHLKAPDIGSNMLMWQESKLPSPGHAYDEQLSGQRTTPVADTTPEGLYLTEIAGNTIEWPQNDAAWEMFDYFEIINTNEFPVTLNEDYEFVYWDRDRRTREKLTVRNYDIENGSEQQNSSSEGCVLEPGEVAVIWVYNKDYDGSEGPQPTISDFIGWHEFNNDITEADNTKIYIVTELAQLGNVKSAIEIYAKPEDGGTRGELISRYLWDGKKADLKEKKVVDLKVSHEGPLAEVYAVLQAANRGSVDEAQYILPDNSGEPPILTLSTSEYDTKWLDTLSNGLDQGEPLNIPYYYEGVGGPVTRAELYWKTDKMDTWKMELTTNFRIYNKWYALISRGGLAGANSVQYYIKLYSSGGVLTTDTTTVKINNQDAGVTGLRLNINNTDPSQEPYSGVIQVSAKDFGGGDVTISLDGTQLETHRAIERMAYIVFDYTGLDSNFKNGFTQGEENEGGKVLGTFSESRLNPTNGTHAFPVGQQYFTYNDDGSVTLQVTMRPGTFGSIWENNTDMNNDNFTVQNFRLMLIDGTVIEPDSCKGVLMENLQTGAETDLNNDSVMQVGDAVGKYIAINLTFNIPAEKAAADAQSAELNTEELAEGQHTLVASNGSESKTVVFTVMNEEPAEEETTYDFSAEMTLSEAGVVADAKVTSVDGSETVTVYPAKEIDIGEIRILEGTGDSTYGAVEREDNTTESTDGQYPYQILEVPVNGDETAMRVEITADASYTDEDDRSMRRSVQMYVLNASTNEWEILNTDADGNNITAVCPVSGYAADGKVKVLVQARTEAYTPYTQEDTFVTETGDNAAWDGTDKGDATLADKIGAPDSYDFSIAWITDTQHYSERYNDYYSDMANWIVDNRQELDIQYVLHTGDIVDEPDEEYEWVYASSQQKIFDDAGMPNGVLGGNHDTAFGNRDYDLYWKYFGADRYEDNPWYGGTYMNNLGHYDIIEKDGLELLMIYISWDVHAPEAEWMNSVLAQYPDIPAIIATHSGLNSNGKQSYTSQYILDNVCSKNKNVIALLGGHSHGASVEEVTYGQEDDTWTVYEVCTDYQQAFEGGTGYIKMIYFDLANGKLYLNSYSPSIDDVNYFDDNEYLASGELPMANVDRVILPISLERSAKSLTVSNVAVTAIGNEVLGTASAAGESTAVSMNYMSGGDTVAALLTDGDGNIVGATKAATFVGGTYEEPVITPPTPPIEDPDQGGDGDDETSELPFPDVEENDWFYESVKYVYDKGLFAGDENDMFNPQSDMNRAMVWTVLARLDGNDVDGGTPWYGLAQEWGDG